MGRKVTMTGIGLLYSALVAYDRHGERWTRATTDALWEFRDAAPRATGELWRDFGPLTPLAPMASPTSDADPVNSPVHYRFENGVEVIDLTEQLSFNAGNAVKYLARAGRKTQDPIEDLRKAEFYVKREIARLQAQGKL
jgi:hypothetical protein